MVLLLAQKNCCAVEFHRVPVALALESHLIFRVSRSFTAFPLSLPPRIRNSTLQVPQRRI
jgi:hypothetical protein